MSAVMWRQALDGRDPMQRRQEMIEYGREYEEYGQGIASDTGQNDGADMKEMALIDG